MTKNIFFLKNIWSLIFLTKKKGPEVKLMNQMIQKNNSGPRFGSAKLKLILAWPCNITIVPTTVSC